MGNITCYIFSTLYATFFVHNIWYTFAYVTNIFSYIIWYANLFLYIFCYIFSSIIMYMLHFPIRCNHIFVRINFIRFLLYIIYVEFFHVTCDILVRHMLHFLFVRYMPYNIHAMHVSIYVACHDFVRHKLRHLHGLLATFSEKRLGLIRKKNCKIIELMLNSHWKKKYMYHSN